MQTPNTDSVSDQRTWQVQNSRTALVTSLIAIKVLNDMRRYIQYNTHESLHKWTYEISAETRVDSTYVDAVISILCDNVHVYHISVENEMTKSRTKTMLLQREERVRKQCKSLRRSMGSRVIFMSVYYFFDRRGHIELPMLDSLVNYVANDVIVPVDYDFAPYARSLCNLCHTIDVYATNASVCTHLDVIVVNDKISTLIDLQHVDLGQYYSCKAPQNPSMFTHHKNALKNHAKNPIIGRVVYLLYTDTMCCYEGYVTDYDATTSQYTVKFEDGETETLSQEGILDVLPYTDAYVKMQEANRERGEVVKRAEFVRNMKKLLRILGYTLKKKNACFVLKSRIKPSTRMYQTAYNISPRGRVALDRISGVFDSGAYTRVWKEQGMMCVVCSQPLMPPPDSNVDQGKPDVARKIASMPPALGPSILQRNAPALLCCVCANISNDLGIKPPPQAYACVQRVDAHNANAQDRIFLHLCEVLCVTDATEVLVIRGDDDTYTVLTSTSCCIYKHLIVASDSDFVLDLHKITEDASVVRLANRAHTIPPFDARAQTVPNKIKNEMRMRASPTLAHVIECLATLRDVCTEGGYVHCREDVTGNTFEVNVVDLTYKEAVEVYFQENTNGVQTLFAVYTKTTGKFRGVAQGQWTVENMTTMYAQTLTFDAMLGRVSGKSDAIVLYKQNQLTVHPLGVHALRHVGFLSRTYHIVHTEYKKTELIHRKVMLHCLMLRILSSIMIHQNMPGVESARFNLFVAFESVFSLTLTSTSEFYMYTLRQIDEILSGDDTKHALFWGVLRDTYRSVIDKSGSEVHTVKSISRFLMRQYDIEPTRNESRLPMFSLLLEYVYEVHGSHPEYVCSSRY